jgi:hypothetical protein
MSPSRNARLDGLIEVRADWRAFARNGANRFHLWTPPPVTRGQLHDAAEAIAAWDDLLYAGFRSEDSQLTRVTASDLSFEPIAMYSREGIGQFGTVRNLVFPMLPLPQAPVVEWLPYVNRGQRYRTYVFGATTELVIHQSDSTVLEELAASAMQNAWGTLRETFNLVADARMVIVRSHSDFHGGFTYDVEPIRAQHLNRHVTGTQVRRNENRRA